MRLPLFSKPSNPRRPVREPALVAGSWLFDPAFYASQANLPARTDPAAHYCQTGWRAGLNPSPYFDTAFYLKSNADVRDSGANPLAHYIRHGAPERRSPSPDFDPVAFSDAHPDIAGDDPAAACVRHFGSYRWEGQRRSFLTGKDAERILGAFALFVGTRLENEEALRGYLDLPDDQVVRKILDSPEFHLNVVEPVLSGRRPKGSGFEPGRNLELIDWAVRVLDLAPATVADLSATKRHWLQLFGLGRGRAVNSRPADPKGNWLQLFRALFADERFRAAYVPDTRTFRDFADALRSLPTEQDIARFREEVAASGLFDAAWYRSSYDDIRQISDPLEHFIRHGSQEKRSPGPNFDARWYFDRHMRGERRGLQPLEHYLAVGRRRGLPTRPESRYEDWLDRFGRPNPAESAALSAHARKLGPTRIFYMLGGADRLSAFYDSLQAQTVGDWTLTLVWTLSGSAPPASLAGVANVQMAEAGDLADALAATTAARVVIVESDVVLEPDFLAQTAAAHLGGARLVYTDFDRRADKGRRSEPCFLPDFSPLLFSQQPRRIGIVSVAEEAGDFSSVAVDGSAPCPAASVLLGNAGRLGAERLSKVTYSRTSPGPLAAEPSRPAASPSLPAGEPPTVAIIVPFRDKADLLRTCVESVFRLTYYDMSRVKLVLVDNGSTEDDTLLYLDELRGEENVVVTRNRQKFNFSRLNNGAAAGRGEDVLVFLNNDIVVTDPFWLTKLVAEAWRDGTGVVGAKLIYPDWTVQHGGVIIGLQGVAGHSHVHLPANAPGHQGLNLLTREISACTGACLAMRRTVFEEVGGFDPDLEVAFNDIALCAVALKLGYRNILIGDPLLIHHESKSRGRDTESRHRARFLAEANLFKERYWPPFAEDRFYSSNLSLYDMYDLAFPPRVARIPHGLKKGRSPVRILMLSSTYQIGHGVAVVVDQQVTYLRQLGYEVHCGGPIQYSEYESCRSGRVELDTSQAAAEYAVAEDYDVVIAHTPPFFSCARFLGPYPVLIQYDYGEPNPDWFADAEARRETLDEKRFSLFMSNYLACISEAVRDEADMARMRVLPIANSHLGRWDGERSRESRETVRRRHGWTDKKVVLNVCRFGRGEQAYKGIDRYIDLSVSARFRWGRDEVVFVLAGKGGPEEVEELRGSGVEVFANLADPDLLDLYLAADAYANFSRWEGYNLGIAQALAIGLPVVASDIQAHRAFPVSLATSQSQAVRELARAFEATGRREPVIYDWKEALDRFAAFIEACRADTFGGEAASEQARPAGDAGRPS